MIVLLAGHWLGAWAWEDVARRLTVAGARVAALTLPGLDPDDPHRETRDIDDQVAAIRELLDRHGVSITDPAVIVAHSGANAPVSVVLDRHPELVRRVVWVDSGPLPSGTVFAPDLAEDVASVPLPEWDVLSRQASLEGLSPEVRETFRSRAMPQPAPILRQRTELTNDARWNVPTTLVCCSLSGDAVHQMADEGHPLFAEVARLTHLEVVDLPTGHWPMWSRSRELTEIIAAAAAAPE